VRIGRISGFSASMCLILTVVLNRFLIATLASCFLPGNAGWNLTICGVKVRFPCNVWNFNGSLIDSYGEGC